MASKVLPKKFLTGYSPSIKIFGGIFIATTVIIGGYFGFVASKPKPTNVSSVSSKSVTPKMTKPSLNGRYSGTSDVAQGISEANVTISGSSVTGDAVYRGPYGVTIPGLKITGTVIDKSIVSQARGDVSGTFTGSGAVMGQTIRINGTFVGNIINTSINVSYSAVTNLGTYPGQITLSKL